MTCYFHTTLGVLSSIFSLTLLLSSSLWHYCSHISIPIMSTEILIHNFKHIPFSLSPLVKQNAGLISNMKDYLFFYYFFKKFMIWAGWNALSLWCRVENMLHSPMAGILEVVSTSCGQRLCLLFKGNQFEFCITSRKMQNAWSKI